MKNRIWFRILYYCRKVLMKLFGFWLNLGNWCIKTGQFFNHLDDLITPAFRDAYMKKYNK